MCDAATPDIARSYSVTTTLTQRIVVQLNHCIKANAISTPAIIILYQILYACLDTHYSSFSNIVMAIVANVMFMVMFMWCESVGIYFLSWSYNKLWSEYLVLLIYNKKLFKSVFQCAKKFIELLLFKLVDT